MDTERRLNEVILENLKKVEVCNDTIFIENGEAIKFYLKYNNKVEFFTYYGKHPIYNGRYLKPVTADIIKAHVKPCDSITRQ